MCRDGVAQDMRPTPYGVHLCLLERASNDAVHDATLPKRQGCRMVPDENLAGVSARPPAPEIRREGAADRRRQGKDQRSRGLRAPNSDDAAAPIDIVDAEINDLTRAQAIDGEDQEDRVIAAADC
jgi:hypothetical protein